MMSSMKRSGLIWVSTIEISRTPQKLHFRMTKKDPGLPSHFHVLNLFKSWSNLGFDQVSNGHKKFKNIVFLCHTVNIQVDKQGLNIFKQ